MGENGRESLRDDKTLPLAMTSASNFLFSVARCMIFVSIVCALTSRKMSTGFVCPILCALSCACASICGFCRPVSVFTLSHQRNAYPILVIKNNRIGRDQVDTQSTRSRAQEEEGRSFGVVTAILEPVHCLATFHWFRGPINAADVPAHVISGPVLRIVMRR